MPMADEINPQMFGEWLAGMSLPERARTLNRIAHDLTICTREFEAATEPFKEPAIVIKRLIGLSELQHHLSSQIGHIWTAKRSRSIRSMSLHRFCSRRQPSIKSSTF
jgi:hypothetical protein